MTPPKTPYEDVWATYPFRNPTFTLTSLLGQNFGLGEGMVLGSLKHPIQHCPTFLSMNLLSTLRSMAQSSFCNSEKCYTYGPVFKCITPAKHNGWFVFRFFTDVLPTYETPSIAMSFYLVERPSRRDWFQGWNTSSAKSIQRYAHFVRLKTGCIPHGSGAQFWGPCQRWITCTLRLMNMQTTGGEL